MIVHLLKTNAGKLDKHNAACDVTSTKSNAEINLVTCSKCKAIHNRYYESSYVMAEDDPFAQKTLNAKDRLEYIRGELRAERISLGEIVELQSLVDYIDRDDVELLEAAGVPEGGQK